MTDPPTWGDVQPTGMTDPPTWCWWQRIHNTPHWIQWEIVGPEWLMHHNIEEWPANMGDNTQFWFFGAAAREFDQEGEWYLVLGERGVREEA